ncbi:MAG: SpaH/EbpB family LPXTG-anchored major pilin [Actinomyces sp.]|uniref:SpaH/EbpB family LPXTG-anchored major pilin n=1 Tax=Actinomyces sp. TaxID=29317 RepID=UPI0026DC5473|nr:SpaH/EbpB family LPXTG-anchored major pilin [Actinomyces sp.]MDO4244347.1 SpaH/EbpB family LPXTG-anchored major pilin [Actinomyces sp.]
MKRPTRLRARGVLAALGALAVGLSGLGAAAAAAPAAPGNIDYAATGSILIHKLESGSMTGAPAVGSPDGQTPVAGTGVPGVVFTAYKINTIDLATADGWTTLSNLSVPADACGADYNSPNLAGHSFDGGTPSTTTDSAGDASITNLSVAAYLVCETSVPSTVNKRSAPFVVTVPLPDDGTYLPESASRTNTWLYDINVYPKNTVVQAPTKGQSLEANALGLKTDNQLSFPVTATVPSIDAGDQFNYFIIEDPLTAALSNGVVDSVTLTPANGSAQTLTATHYTATTGQTPTVAFTQAGLTLLKANPNATVTVTFKAEVTDLGTAGSVPNTANIYVDTITDSAPPSTPSTTPPSDPSRKTPSNTVVTTWGAATVSKTDARSNTALAGATFQIYEAAQPYAGTCGTEIAGGAAPISIDGVNTFTTQDGTGQVVIEGLFVDSKIGAAGAADVTPDRTKHCYVLVETSAPVGYTLPQGDSARTALTITTGQTATDNVVTIENSKSVVPALPLTGAAGKILMTLAGVALVAAACGWAIVSRRRRES